LKVQVTLHAGIIGGSPGVSPRRSFGLALARTFGFFRGKDLELEISNFKGRMCEMGNLRFQI
jgi:hypothetical protein